MKLSKEEKVLVVGDVHGCYDELISLIHQSGIRVGEDRVILLGDVVDRGPKTLEVIEWINQSPGVFSILGNHELKHFRGEDLINDPAVGIQKKRLSENDYQLLLKTIAEFPLYINLSFPDRNYLLTHGGISGEVWEKIKHHRLSPFAHYQGELSEDIRILTGRGSMNREGPIDEDLVRKQENNQKTEHTKFIYGHWVKDHAEITDFSIYLDTGAVMGNKLSAVLLPDEIIFSVEAGRDYARETLRDHLDDFYLERMEDLSWEERRELLEDTEVPIPRTKARIQQEIEEKMALLEKLQKAAAALKERFPAKTPKEKAQRGKFFHEILSPKREVFPLIKSAYFKEAQLDWVLNLTKEEEERINRELDEILKGLQDRKSKPPQGG